METLIEYSNGKLIPVPPDERESLNSLRGVVDEMFVSMNEYMQTFGTYKNMETCEDGIRKHLRSWLFKPMRQGRRYSKGVETGTGASKDEVDRGGTTASMKEAKLIRARMEACENKLFSLLYTVIYDSAARNCLLVEKNPSAMKLIKQNEGSNRTVSCLRGTRVFLRDLMCSVLCHHGRAVKMLYDVLPPVFTVLPQMFVLIARTFFGILSLQSPKDSNKKQNDKPERAFETLRASVTKIKSYITVWERRNFMPYTELKHCRQASLSEGCYKAIRDLLQAMVVVLPPSGDEGLNPTFRKRACFDLALDRNKKSRTEPDKCVAVGERSPRSGAIEVVQSVSKACHGFVDALTTCAVGATRMLPPQLQESLGTENCPPEVWLSSRNLGHLTRLNDLAESEMRFRTEAGEKKSRGLTALFVRQIRGDIAQCWTALGMSNIPSVKYLNSLEISGSKEVAEATTELIFGGGIAAMTLYERKRDITKICAELQSEKAPFVISADNLKDNKEAEPSRVHEGTDGSGDPVRTENIINANGQWSNATPSLDGGHGASRRRNSMPGGADQEGILEHTGTAEGPVSEKRVGEKRRFNDTKSAPGYRVHRLD